MKSSYDSAEHQRIRETREALRAHAIDQNNTGRTPERVIDILSAHGCAEPHILIKNIFTGELTASERRIIREISKKSPDTIPPVTPLQKPEEPKRGAKHTPLREPKVPYVSWDRIARGARPGDSSGSKHQDDTVCANPETEVPAGRSYFSETKTLESVPKGYLLMDLKMLTRTAARMNAILVKEETLEEIKFLKLHGTLELDDLGNGNLYMKFNSEKSHMNRPVMATELSDIIAELVAQIKKLESQKPSTVRIHLSTLTVCDSKNPDEGVEVSSETLRRIKELKTYGELTVKIHQENQFRFRFMPSAVGGPHTSYGYTLDEAMEKLWKYLNEKQVETPSDTVKIDIDDLQICSGTGPGVVEIPRKTGEDMKKLKSLGRLILVNEDKGYWLFFYGDDIKRDFSGETIEEVIQIMVGSIQHKYPGIFE